MELQVGGHLLIGRFVNSHFDKSLHLKWIFKFLYKNNVIFENIKSQTYI